MFSLFCARSIRLVFLINCTSLIIFCRFSALGSQSIGVAWIPSSDSQVVSYKVYFGTASHSYVSQVAVGNTNVATISGLADGVTYYFAAAAVDGAGNESAYSEEVSFTTAVPNVATLTPVPEPAGVIGFTVSGGTGPVYVVQSSTDLVNWVSVQMNTVPFTFTDVCPPDVPQRFYRTFCPVP